MDSIDIELDTLKITGDSTKLFEELAKASLEFSAVPKMATGQIGKDRKFKYADFITLMRCVRPALGRYGIVILQPLHYRADRAITTTILAGHGATVQTSFAFHADPNPQEFGRHHTYYRRYQLQALLGLGGDDDADNLPDVNEGPQFTEKSKPESDPPSKPENGAPKEATASADKKSVSAKGVKEPPVSLPAAQKASGSSPESLKSINARLQAGIEELKWSMAQVKEFYATNVDKGGFEKASNLTIEQKTALLDKLVNVAGITPF
jgi:hypothetical protein